MLSELVGEWETVPSITIAPSTRKGLPSLLLTATATLDGDSTAEALLSVSVSVDMGMRNGGGLSAALLLLLYDLDSKMVAAKGWGATETA